MRKVPLYYAQKALFCLKLREVTVILCALYRYMMRKIMHFTVILCAKYRYMMRSLRLYDAQG